MHPDKQQSVQRNPQSSIANWKTWEKKKVNLLDMRISVLDWRIVLMTSCKLEQEIWMSTRHAITSRLPTIQYYAHIRNVRVQHFLQRASSVLVCSAKRCFARYWCWIISFACNANTARFNRSSSQTWGEISRQMKENRRCKFRSFRRATCAKI